MKATLEVPSSFRHGRAVSLSIGEPSSIERLEKLLQLYYEFDGITVDLSQVRTGLATLLADSSLGRALIVRVDGQDAGFSIFTFGYDLEFGGKQATITEFFLAPEYRRVGLGKACLEGVEAICKQLGIHALELQVERNNTNAQAFYKQMGFRVHDRIAMSKGL
jgi:ribosomal protein S18 acetylase RimI-like enzyme